MCRSGRINRCTLAVIHLLYVLLAISRPDYSPMGGVGVEMGSLFFALVPYVCITVVASRALSSQHVEGVAGVPCRVIGPHVAALYSVDVWS